MVSQRAGCLLCDPGGLQTLASPGQTARQCSNRGRARRWRRSLGAPSRECRESISTTDARGQTVLGDGTNLPPSAPREESAEGIPGMPRLNSLV